MSFLPRQFCYFYLRTFLGSKKGE